MWQTELTLREGSGYFLVNTSIRGIADVEFQESLGTAEVGFSFSRGRDKMLMLLCDPHAFICSDNLNPYCKILCGFFFFILS